MSVPHVIASHGTSHTASQRLMCSQKPGLGMGALLHVGAAFLGHAHQYGRIFRWHDEGANHGQVFADQCVTDARPHACVAVITASIGPLKASNGSSATLL